jgi:hypothetical protein
MRTGRAVFLSMFPGREPVKPFSSRENGLHGCSTSPSIRKIALTAPPLCEVESATNSACWLLPEDTRIAFRARSATLEQFPLNRSLEVHDVHSRGNGREFAGRRLSLSNSPPVFAAQTSSAPGRLALAS